MAAGIWISIGLSAVAVAALGDLLRLVWVAKRTETAPNKSDGEVLDELLPYLPVGTTSEPAPAASIAHPIVADTVVNEPEELTGNGKKYLVTHTDFDGLTSGALLLRALGSECPIKFSSSRWLHVALESLAARIGTGDEIFIADLAMEPERIEEFQRVFQMIAQRQGRVHWFDHHVWSDQARSLAEQVCAQFILQPSRSTAAQIIKERYLPTDAHAEQILKLVTRGFAEEPWVKNWTYLLSELGRARVDAETKARVIRKLALAADLAAPERWMVRKGRKRRHITESMINDVHRRETTLAGRSLLIIDARPFRIERMTDGRKLLVIAQQQPEITVARGACERWGAHFSVVLWSNTRCSLSRGTDPTVDFRWLFGEKQLNRGRLTVRGHAYAAGVYLGLSRRSAFRQMINWHPPVEVENFIGLLKERL